MSLATQYRPASFDAIIGQRAAVSTCKQAVRRNGQHSFLLSGPSGCGKTTLARLMAQGFINGAGTAANIEEIPAANFTGVEDMRGIVHKLLFRAMGSSPIKSVILDECHRLTGNAWDALLKPIEEPPSHVYWFLCTTLPEKVPKTIQTRCARIDLKPVSETDLLELMCGVADKEGLKTPDEVLEAIAEGSGGSPRQALTFLESCGHLKSASEARLAMRSGGQSKEAIDLCRFLVGGRGQTWAEAIKHVQSLNGVDAEGVRITVVNYISSVLMNTKDEQKATTLLRLLEVFLKPYNSSDRMGPLLHSLGLALGLDR